MDSMKDKVKKSALGLAKAGKLNSAYGALKYYKMLCIEKEEVEELTKEVGLTYLRYCGEPIHFGVVPDGAYHTGRISWDSYTGLSPHAKPTYYITNPAYDKYGNNREVLTQLSVYEWIYGKFTQSDPDVFHGGRVVGFNDGTVTVIPFFATAGIEAIARDAIKKLKGEPYHEWDVPDNFSMDSQDVKALQEEQTDLALKSVGLPTKY